MNIDLQNLVGGALQEKFKHSFKKVMENMQDVNTPYTNKLGSDLDIVKVERSQVIWERPEEKTNEELHRKMWNWLAENPEMGKEDWFVRKKYTADMRPESGCFACDECERDCGKCPLDRRVIGCGGGLFNIWSNTPDMHTKSRLAKVIAGLPWKSVE